MIELLKMRTALWVLARFICTSSGVSQLNLCLRGGADNEDGEEEDADDGDDDSDEEEDEHTK